MSAVSVRPSDHQDHGLELWLDSYAAVIRWMGFQFPRADEQELHDSVADAWHEICAKGTHTSATPQARGAWKSLSRLRQLDRLRARRYRDQHGLGSVVLSDELTETTGQDDPDLRSMGEQEAASASLREVVAYLDEHLSPLEQQYLQLRWHGNLGRTEIAAELGVSTAAVGRLVTSTAKCVHRFYAARESRELCQHARELINVLVAQQSPGVLGHPALRAHLGSCPQCQQLATAIPRELRGAAPVVGATMLGAITTTAGAGLALTQGAGGVLAGLSAAKIAVAAALVGTVASGALALSVRPTPTPTPRHRSAAQERPATSGGVALPLTTPIGAVADPARDRKPAATVVTRGASKQPHPRSRTKSSVRSTTPTRDATPSDTEALAGLSATTPTPVRSQPVATASASAEPENSHDAAASETEQAFGIGESP